LRRSDLPTGTMNDQQMLELFNPLSDFEIGHE
jgi:hypothetical protein